MRMNYSISEAAAELGVGWRALEGRLRSLGWLVQVSGGCWRTSAGAVQNGYLAPTIVQSKALRISVPVEVGFRITRAGITAYRQIMVEGYPQ